jgi:23S rRNA pseudouridine2605 synthase
MEERIQKILSRAGLGSRRSCETYISAGRVTVNGTTAKLGDKADPDKDSVQLDRQPILLPESSIYVALYKPRGVLSTVDAPDPRPTVRSLVPIPGQIYPVGRLDVDSEGLVLLTDDGELTDRLTHPRYGHEKEYRVLVASHPDSKQVEAWRHGVVMADGHKSAPVQVTLEGYSGKGAWLRIIMTEGRKRQIRETGSLIGLPVVRIIRTRIGTLQLGRMKPSEWRKLTSSEITELKNYTRESKTDRKTKPKNQGSPPARRARPLSFRESDQPVPKKRPSSPSSFKKKKRS